MHDRVERNETASGDAKYAAIYVRYEELFGDARRRGIHQTGGQREKQGTLRNLGDKKTRDGSNDFVTLVYS